MMRFIHRASFALVAITLVLSLLAAPAAWAGPITPQGPTAWLGQLWGWVSSWGGAPADSAAATDSSGASEETSTSTETWDPTPLDPSSTSAVEDDDEDRGATMDPNG